MASARPDVATRLQSRSWVKVGITSFSFIAAVVGAFYFGSQHSASPIGNAPQSAVTRDTPANVSKGADDANAPVGAVRAPDAQGRDDTPPDVVNNAAAVVAADNSLSNVPFASFWGAGHAHVYDGMGDDILTAASNYCVHNANVFPADTVDFVTNIYGIDAYAHQIQKANASHMNYAQAEQLAIGGINAGYASDIFDASRLRGNVLLRVAVEKSGCTIA